MRWRDHFVMRILLLSTPIRGKPLLHVSQQAHFRYASSIADLKLQLAGEVGTE
jgi:hypothetical protein